MATITQVGLGAIGSHLAPHLARMDGVERITLIDPDRYSLSNLLGQDITTADLGRSKVAVQAARLRRINPALEVRVLEQRVEETPRGLLRADVLCACVDSARARQYLNQVAWRLGMLWIDAGVEAQGWLARINVYRPGPETPCLECGWDERHYRNLEQVYACTGPGEPAPTRAPSSLGALAAALQASECRKLLSGERERSAEGKQVLLDTAWHKHYVTRMRRNPRCRFDHVSYAIGDLAQGPRGLTLRETFALAGRQARALRVDGRPFARTVRCAACGKQRGTLRLADTHRRRDRTCRACGQACVAAGWDLAEELTAASLRATEWERSLDSVGLRAGDLFSLSTDQGEMHFCLGGDERL